MHIPDALLSPAVAATTGLVGLGGFGYALRRLERALGEKTTVLMGIVSAFIFAAQMVNFPIGFGISGHLMGGVLAAVVLGPWAGAGVIGAVLIVQCLMFADGGLTALGANFVNMGLIGAVGGYAIYAPLRRLIGGPRGVLIGAMVAAWFSLLLAAAAFALELALSGKAESFVRVLGWMMLVHAVIGLGEAVITGLVVRFVLLTRPDLIPDLSEGDASGAVPAAGRLGQTVLGGLAIALGVAAFLAPIASESPDGLEWVGARLGFLDDEPEPVLASPMPDYQLALSGQPLTLGVATALAGIVGTLTVFAVGLVLGQVFARRPKLAAIRVADRMPGAGQDAA